jgi:mannose-1-phosphate guanylyltransferase
MKAMILAAGLGTRLRPLTDSRPKALVEVGQMPLLEIVIRRLKYFGFTDIIINVHHFAEQIIHFLERNDRFGIRIEISDERNQLLDTGGGLKKAMHFFDDDQPFLLCNTDILSNIDLHTFYEAHLQSPGALATLAVRRRESSRYFIFNEQQMLHGWVNVNTGEMIAARHQGRHFQLQAFSGFHIISPMIFRLMPSNNVFSIIDIYLDAAAHHPIMAYAHDDDFLLDVGKVNALKEAEELVKKLNLA